MTINADTGSKLLKRQCRLADGAIDFISTKRPPTRRKILFIITSNNINQTCKQHWCTSQVHLVCDEA